MEYLVIYEKGPPSWGAYVPDLPGCVAAGETQEVVRELIEGAIDLHLRGMREDGDPIPEPTAVAAGIVDTTKHRQISRPSEMQLQRILDFLCGSTVDVITPVAPAPSVM
jgi:predicted RNase H-like HicB family nuclease